jgi:glutamine synthetase
VVGATRSGDEVLTTAARLRTDGIRFVRLLHSDPYGRARSKELPVDAFPGVLGGLGYCEASLVEGLDGEPLMDPEFPGGQGFPDVHAVPDPATLRVAPWQPDTAWMLADLRAPDGPSALCCRGVLARQVAALEQRGLRAVVASEPEFYLVREDEAADEGHARRGDEQTRSDRTDATVHGWCSFHSASLAEPPRRATAPRRV